MSKSKKDASSAHQGFLLASNPAVALALPGLTAALQPGNSIRASSAQLDRTDVALEASIATFTTLKEVAESISSIGGPLKATCDVMMFILETIKVILILFQVSFADTD
jgi:hypothetical protein